MKRLTIAGFLLVAFFFGATANAADFNKGVRAYNKDDYKTALQEFKPLAEQGNPEAQNFLGRMYRDGKGVPQSYQKAIKWFLKAAEQGHEGAQLSLGFIYSFHEEGVPRDYIRAYMWFNVATSAGNDKTNALMSLDAQITIAEEMSTEDIITAQTRAQQCIWRNYKDC